MKTKKNSLREELFWHSFSHLGSSVSGESVGQEALHDGLEAEGARTNKCLYSSPFIALELAFQTGQPYSRYAFPLS